MRLALILLLAILPAAAQGQDPPEPRGAKGPIGRAELFEQLQRSAASGRAVSGYVIQGDDLVAILTETDLRIRIEDAVIEGGLVFRTPTVSAKIEITNSEIRATTGLRGEWVNHAVYARGVQFAKDMTFRGTTFAGRVDFIEARFLGSVDISSSLFLDFADFRLAVFEARAQFLRTTFDAVNFGEATFKQTASFSRAIFDQPAAFDGAEFKGSARFRKTVFKQDQAFRARFLGGVNFKEASFGGEVDFFGLVFPAEADFTGAEFLGPTDFSEARFEQAAMFHGARFSESVAFNGAEFQGTATFQSAEFDLTADFSDAIFRRDAGFFEARFGEFAFFPGVSVARNGSFGQAVFADEATFEGATFGESLDLQGACFADLLTLTNAHYGEFVDLRGARIAKLDLISAHRPTIFKSRFDLRGARISDAHVQDILFEKNVDFSDARFGFRFDDCDSSDPAGPAEGTILFQFVTFEDDVSFARAGFAGRLAMENLRFRGEANFTDADFSGILQDDTPSFLLSYVDFGDLRLSWRQLPDPRVWGRVASSLKKPLAVKNDPEPVSRVIGRLEERFRGEKQLSDANEAYYHRKRAELARARTEGWGRERVVLEAEWVFWGAISGYGTKIWWALGWAILADLIFTLVYWTWATVERTPHPTAKQEFSFRLRLLDFPKQYASGMAALGVTSQDPRKFVNALRVSSVILFKIGYRDTTLSGRVGRLDMAYVVALEWALGFYVLAAVTLTLANTQPLINRLLTGVF